MDLSGYIVTELKQLIRNLNLHIKIIGYSKMKRSDLIESINKHVLVRGDGKLVSRTTYFDKNLNERKGKAGRPPKK